MARASKRRILSHVAMKRAIRTYANAGDAGVVVAVAALFVSLVPASLATAQEAPASNDTENAVVDEDRDVGNADEETEPEGAREQDTGGVHEEEDDRDGEGNGNARENEVDEGDENDTPATDRIHGSDDEETLTDEASEASERPRGDDERRERPEGTLTEAEKEENRARLRERRAAGWTLMHASPRSRLGVWLTHGNDDIARFFHDLHGFVQLGFRIREWDFALYSMWGARFQATSLHTGVDALWVGGKVLFPALAPTAGLLGAGVTVGLPTNSRVDGDPAVFADHANSLIIVDTLTLDVALFNTIYFSDVAGLNLHANLQLALGMREAASVNAGIEFYLRHGLPDKGVEEEWDGWSNDLRGGVQFSTAFTPLVVYVEPGLLFEEAIRFSFRAAVMLGVGKNLRNLSDVQLLGIFEWRFG